MSSGKIDTHGHLTGEILPSDQRRVIEQAYFPLGKPLRKQAKTIKDQEKNN